MSDSTYSMLKLTKLATKYQQNFYELLPDWFEYDSNDHLYMKQNIGFALFGPAEINKDGVDSRSNNNCSLDTDQNCDVFSRVLYNKKSCGIINIIYKQIIKYGVESQSNSIYVGVIYNVIFNCITTKKSKGNSNNSEKRHNEMFPIPVFKIKRLNTVWFIDNSGRIYESWNDYLQNNKLPKCTMVYPKDGVYKCNPSYRITEQSSTVWIEVKDSAACSTKNAIVNVFDNVSNVLTFSAVVGLGVTSFFTPVGPMLATAGLIGGAIGGTWNITRKSYQLIDRTKHKQSINPIDKNAFPAWFEITSTALTLGTTGGTMFLTRAIAKGKSISSVAKVVYNSVTIGNLTINGINVIYQGCQLIEKCTKHRKIDFSDIFIFLSHTLFFGNTILSCKLADELIGSSNGTILERFKSKLRFNRLRKEFNSKNVKNRTESIIYKVKKIISKEEFLSNINKINLNKNFQTMYENGQIKINNINLLDPLVFACQLLTTGTISIFKTKSNSSSVDGNATDIISILKELLTQLLTDFYKGKGSDSNQKLPEIDHFNDIILEMKDMTNAIDILKKIFKISKIIIQHCNEPEQFLLEAIYFTWEYSKANIKKYATDICSTKASGIIYKALTKVITMIYDVVNTMAKELFEAFYVYMLNTEPLNYM